MSSTRRNGSSGSSLICPSPSDVRSQSANQLALVEWLTGVYAGTMTHNVDVRWIQHFLPGDVFRNESFAVEWRVPPKPKKGWPILDCKIIEISDNEEFLRHKMLSIQTSDRSDLDFGENERLSSSLSSSNALSEDIKRLIAKAVGEATQRMSQERVSRSNSSSPPPDPPTEVKVLVGKALYVKKVSLTLAKSAGSFSRCIGILLRAGFSRRRLIRSSYAGQRRTKHGQTVAKPSLKKYQKMADIHEFVLSRFPHITQSQFGGAVNSFLGEGPNKETEVMLLDESESEDES